jgi:phage-related protein
VNRAAFHPKARDVIRKFAEDLRREIGKVIFDLQKGEKLSMPLSRPMSSVAAGVEELPSETAAARIESFITPSWPILF